MKSPLLLSLDRHSKQAGDKSHLPQDIPFLHPMYLSFPEHVHDLVSLQCLPCGLKRKEAEPWFDEPLDKAMILLDQVVEVFDLQ